ncbi:MAG: Maf family nucleotide pyrophosphatase [Muribaculaceae bacterium]|nr:Maf family nucleotide pyrophosphatase [Muribaculaceae bacterium]
MENLKNWHFILASGSPRRRELLAMLDIDFTVDTSHKVDEIVPDGAVTSPEDIPAYLSQIKAEAYRGSLRKGDLLITADTVVILDGRVLGKPSDNQDARKMLRDMSGRSHTVVTGVSILTDENLMTTFAERTEVEFSKLTDEEIDYYVEHYTPLDKAGAYGIQEWIGAAAVKRIDGSFYNVMGLPVNRLYRELKNLLSRSN